MHEQWYLSALLFLYSGMNVVCLHMLYSTNLSSNEFVDHYCDIHICDPVLEPSPSWPT